MSVTAEQAWQVYQAADCLHDGLAIEQALQTMAVDINRDLAGKNPVFVCVMTGALMPMGRLLGYLDFPLEIDYIHATRYRGATEGGEIHWLAHPHKPIKDRVVVVVDDILDEGFTLAAILEDFRAQGAAEVRTAVLVNKQHGRRYNNLQADYVGLQVDDRYVFGCGMDYHGYLRNINGIYAVNNNK